MSRIPSHWWGLISGGWLMASMIACIITWVGVLATMGSWEAFGYFFLAFANAQVSAAIFVGREWLPEVLDQLAYREGRRLLEELPRHLSLPADGLVSPYILEAIGGEQMLDGEWEAAASTYRRLLGVEPRHRRATIQLRRIEVQLAA